MPVAPSALDVLSQPTALVHVWMSTFSETLVHPCLTSCRRGAGQGVCLQPPPSIREHPLTFPTRRFCVAEIFNPKFIWLSNNVLCTVLGKSTLTNRTFALFVKDFLFSEHYSGWRRCLGPEGGWTQEASEIKGRPCKCNCTCPVAGHQCPGGNGDLDIFFYSGSVVFICFLRVGSMNSYQVPVPSVHEGHCVRERVTSCFPSPVIMIPKGLTFGTPAQQWCSRHTPVPLDMWSKTQNWLLHLIFLRFDLPESLLQFWNKCHKTWFRINVPGKGANPFVQIVGGWLNFRIRKESSGVNNTALLPRAECLA